MRRISSRKGSRVPLAALLLGALAALLALARLAFPSAFLAAEAPLLSAGGAFAGSFGGVSAGFESARALEEQRAALAAQNAALEEENAVLSAKLADLAALVGAAGAGAPGVAAGVVARPPESAYDTLIVAAGTGDGVAAGDAVYAAGGIPLGSVTALSGGYARVTLLSAEGLSTEAWLGPAREPITLVGQSGGAFMAEAPKSASTTPGEEVYVAGPGSLPIGTVAGRAGAASAPFDTLYIRGALNPASLAMVLIRPGAPAWGSLAATTSAP
ncbi:MAG TPA: rod shape-determining protein MreC [Candidatus Paceibacterota bacterium]|nr:rod shape-determining protein MreC [Candidatus Paceibacterota bacterium]